MANKIAKRHAALNPTPQISMFGDNKLDVLLNGGFTDELRKELDRGIYSVPDSAQDTATPFIPKNQPIRVVFNRIVCRCCHNETKVFSHFCQKVTEKVKDMEVTRYKTIEFAGVPDEISFFEQIVPFCMNCLHELYSAGTKVVT